MSRIAPRFDSLRGADRRALVPYITAGDPTPAATPALMQALVAGGADVIELGVPFSDPMADGPAIQAACERALAQSTTLADVLDCVARFRATDADTPVVLMGYLNPIEAMGLARFAERAAAAGVDGVLIVDMTAEEAPETLPVLRAHGIDPICLVAPTTTAERMQRICRHGAGYIYYVSTKGVTGGSGIDVAGLSSQITAIRGYTALPVAVGFGIREPADAAAVGAIADGVVVGSVLVRQVAEAETPAAAAAAVRATLAAMRAALDHDTRDATTEAGR